MVWVQNRDKIADFTINQKFQILKTQSVLNGRSCIYLGWMASIINIFLALTMWFRPLSAAKEEQQTFHRKVTIPPALQGHKGDLIDLKTPNESADDISFLRDGEIMRPSFRENHPVTEWV